MKILHFSILILLSAFIMTACQKENIDEIIPEDPGYTTDTVDVNPLIQMIRSYSPDSLIIDCIRIPYPVKFVSESGKTLTINSEAELLAADTLNDAIADFVYPFEATNNQGQITITGVEDLFLALTNCEPVVYNCANDQDAHVLLFFNALNIFTLNHYPYTINYPVKLMVEGNEVTLNQDSDYLPAIGGSPFNYLDTKLVYPITIKQFGKTIQLNSDDDVCEFYQTLDEACTNKPAHIQFFFNEGPGRPISCTYFINYPVSIVYQGNTVAIGSREDYLNILDASPNAYDNIELVYPVSGTRYPNGDQIFFQSEADICQFLNDCF